MAEPESLRGREPARPGARSPVPFWVALIALPVVLVISQLVGSIAHGIALAVVKAVTGQEPELRHPAAIVSGMATGSALLIAVSLAVPLLLHGSPRVVYRLWSAPWPVFFAAAAGTVALGPLADALMVRTAELYPDATRGALLMLHDLAQSHSFVLLWPFFALLPGLSEELFFRGFIQTAFVRRWAAIAVSALSFALFHLDPHHIVGVFPLGLFLAWVASRYGALVTIVAHVVNNTVALLTIQVSELDVGYGTEVPMPAWWVAVGLSVWAGCTYVLVRRCPAAGRKP